MKTFYRRLADIAISLENDKLNRDLYADQVIKTPNLQYPTWVLMEFAEQLNYFHTLSDSIVTVLCCDGTKLEIYLTVKDDFGDYPHLVTVHVVDGTPLIEYHETI